VLTTELQSDTLRVRLSGPWTVERLVDIERELAGLQSQGAKQIQVDCSAIEQADLGPMWLLRNALQAQQAAGATVQFTPSAPEHIDFLNELKAPSESPDAAHESTRFSLPQVIAFLGKHSIELGHHALGHLGHLGRFVATEVRAVRHPKHLRISSVVRHVYEAGIQAIPIVAMIAFFVSVIIAYIGASQLRSFGATIYTVDLITIGVLRELGVLLTAIIVAGRSGSAFAAEIGVMQLNEEVDALKSTGLDPIEVLVAPRVLGLVIALPLLTVIADIMGLAGGALLSNWLLDIPLEQFISRVREAMAPTTFWAGLIKAPVFAVLIAMIGTYRGMQVRDSSRELGRLTTTAVVESIFMVIFANAIFAIIFVETNF
jgi:phospholipid/cholesterol/gamma-HCH transport system permease protein